MKKALAICRQHTELSPIFERLHALIKDYNDRIDFLKRQEAKLNDEFAVKREPVWDEIRNTCKTLGLLPGDYNEEKYHFHYDADADLLFVCDGAEHQSIQALLGPFFRGGQ